MNRKAFELTITTLILFILGILVLIGLAYTTIKAYERYKATSEPFLDVAQSASVKRACELPCSTNDRLAFCCTEHEIDKVRIKCFDERLDISCSINCNNFQC